MRRLSRHVGSNIFFAIAMALLVLVGLDVLAALIDEAGDTRNNYHFSDALIYGAPSCRLLSMNIFPSRR